MATPSCILLKDTTPCLSRDLNLRPSGWESDVLTIRPRRSMRIYIVPISFCRSVSSTDFVDTIHVHVHSSGYSTLYSFCRFSSFRIHEGRIDNYLPVNWVAGWLSTIHTEQPTTLSSNGHLRENDQSWKLTPTFKSWLWACVLYLSRNQILSLPDNLFLLHSSWIQK
jgi:hypothetical protein